MKNTKKTEKTLSLSRETLRRLTAKDLGKVAGGAPTAEKCNTASSC